MIIYFSGTGNTAYCARALSKLLNDPNTVELTRVLLRIPSSLNLAHVAGPIIWMCPVYSWGIPPVVRQVLKHCTLPDPAQSPHHLVLTCGDDCGNADKQWRQIMHKRGAKTLSATSLQMPNIYVCMKGFDVDPPTLEQEKISNVECEIQRVANIINSGLATTRVTRGKYAWIKTHIIYPWFVRYEMSPKPFHALQSQCIKCGKCVGACPMQNIAFPHTLTQNNHNVDASNEHMRDAQMPQLPPVWGSQCALCLRCYHVCPTSAVQYGKATLAKGQYQTLLNK